MNKMQSSTNDHQKIISSYAPALFIGDKDIKIDVDKEDLSLEIKKAIIKELKNIAKFETQYQNVNWLFSGYEAIKDKKVKVYLTKSWDEEPFSVVFNIYDCKKINVIKELVNQLNKYRRVEGNGPTWFQAPFVENKSQQYLSSFYHENSYKINVDKEVVVLSDKRIKFKSWDKPSTIVFDDYTTLWISYLNQFKHFNINVVLKGLKEKNDDEKNTVSKIFNKLKAPLILVGSSAIFGLIIAFGLTGGSEISLDGVVALLSKKLIDVAAEDITTELLEETFSEIEVADSEVEINTAELNNFASTRQWEEIVGEIEKWDLDFTEISAYEPLEPSLIPEEIIDPAIDELSELPSLNTISASARNELAEKISDDFFAEFLLSKNVWFSEAEQKDFNNTKSFLDKILQKITSEWSSKVSFELNQLTLNAQTILQKKIDQKLNYQIVKFFQAESKNNQAEIQKINEEVSNDVDFVAIIKNQSKKLMDLQFSNLIGNATHEICQKLHESIQSVDKSSAEFKKWYERFKHQIKKTSTISMMKSDELETNNYEILMTSKNEKIKQFISEKFKEKTEDWLKNFAISKILTPKISNKLKTRWANSYEKNYEKNTKILSEKITEKKFKDNLLNEVQFCLRYRFYQAIKDNTKKLSENLLEHSIAKRLQKAITNKETNSYNFVKNERHGLFDREFKVFYYVIELKKQIAILQKNSQFDPNNFNLLKSNLLDQLQKLEVLKSWYDKNKTESAKFLEKITKIIRKATSKTMTINNQKVNFNASKINAIKYEIKNMETLHVTIQYSGYDNQQFVVKINILDVSKKF